MQVLLKGGATVGAGDPTALHYAAMSGKVEPFAMLVSAGAKLDNPHKNRDVSLSRLPPCVGNTTS